MRGQAGRSGSIQSVRLGRLGEAVGLNEEGTVKLLLEMKIANMLSLRIDEEAGQVAILNCEARKVERSHSDGSMLAVKIALV